MHTPTAADALDRLAVAADHFRPSADDASIAGGHGLGLLMCEALWRGTADSRWIQRADEHLTEGCKALNSGISTSFFRSAPGFGWAACMWSRTSGAPEPSQLGHQIGRLVLQALTKRPAIAFDVVHGLAGLTIFARGLDVDLRDELLDACWLALRDTGPSAHPVLWWVRGTERADSGDLGLAHGACGVLAALCAARLSGWDAPGLDQVLQRGGHWLWELCRVRSERPTLPYSCDASDGPARLAWCYGTASAAVAFLWLSRLLPEFGDPANQCIRACANEALSPDHGIVDACLCHGHAGWAYLARRFEEQDPSSSGLLRSSSERCAKHAIETLLRSSDGWRTPSLVGGQWRDMGSLLEGAPGVALALASLRNPAARTWEGALLLDLPN